MIALAAESGDEVQARAEVTLFRRIAIGAGIGALVCAGVWMGIVVLALARSDTSLGPMLSVGAGCGVFAGLFLGGSAGALSASGVLEAAEHKTLRH
jgi:hypothetical protein